MKYSVIIPAYKCESTLEKTVSSIQSCGLTDFEIILVDDGSPDGTPALCDRLAAEQENVRCFHQPNAGVSSARNHGLREAKGDYVWFFDSDDLVDPGSMERAVKIIEVHTPDMLIFGMSFDFYRDGERYNRWDLVYPEEALLYPQQLSDQFEALYQNNALTSSCNKLIRRKLLEENHLMYDTEKPLMEDFLFVVQVIRHCRTVYTLPQVIYRYIHLEVKRGEDDNAVIRVSKISNLERYLAPFEEELADHQKTLVSLYYMLLEQRLRYQRPSEIEVTADHFCAGPFSKEGPYFDLCTASQRKTAEMLQKHQCFRLYLHYRFRRKAISILRKTPIYGILKRLR